MVKHSLLFLSNWQPVTINIVVNITKFSQKNVATFCSKIQASKILIRENSAHKIVAMKVFFYVDFRSKLKMMDYFTEGSLWVRSIWYIICWAGLHLMYYTKVKKLIRSLVQYFFKKLLILNSRNLFFAISWFKSLCF